MSNKQSKAKIWLNDILRLERINNFPGMDNVRVRFIKNYQDADAVIEVFQDSGREALLKDQYWNYGKRKLYKPGQITVGLIRVNANDNSWLLFHVGKVIKDLDKMDGVGYEFEEYLDYEPYYGRVLIKYHNKSQNMVRTSEVMTECEVTEIRAEIFDQDIFPGYEWVNVSWKTLKRVVTKPTWRTALTNQKGVYLITDTKTGKMYVGSASGNDKILGRWQAYLDNGHGGNKDLVKLVKEKGFDYVKQNFRYALLDQFKASTSEEIILRRESYWKNVLLTKDFGYNGN